MAEFSKQREEKVITKMTVLEVHKLSSQIIAIVELHDETVPKAGMCLKFGESFYKITSVGLKRNLVKAPAYQHILAQKNIRELVFNHSNYFVENIHVNTLVELVNCLD